MPAQHNLQHAFVVSPSPRTLFADLSDDEKVAIDLILQGDADRLAEIISSPGRRGYLRGLAAQLHQLGTHVRESATMDVAYPRPKAEARAAQERYDARQAANAVRRNRKRRNRR